MVNKFYYLCGLPRAGNTLFASLMNQNPKISVTANSIVCSLFCGSNMLKKSDIYLNYPDSESLNNVTRNIFKNYYSHWKADYIIDRSMWGLPEHLEILKEFAPNKVKIIVLVRDIKEILASFIKFSYSNETNYIARNGRTLEERCDYVMANGGELHRWIRAVYNLTKPENMDYVHLIEYNDLINNTKDELNKVYDYLNIPKFEHKLNNLIQLSNNNIEYNDTILGGQLHTIKTDNISKSNFDRKNYLPNDVDTRYNTDSFWGKNN